MIEIFLVRLERRTHGTNVDLLFTYFISLPRAFSGCPSGQLRSVRCGVKGFAYLLPVAHNK